ncbi:alpha/beta hydrolase [Oleiagrimonas citrea]
MAMYLPAFGLMVMHNERDSPTRMRREASISDGLEMSMKSWWVIVLCLCVVVAPAAQAKSKVWSPTVGHKQVLLWPGKAPDLKPVPGPETLTQSSGNVAGRPWMAVTNVTRPTMTVYAPKGKNTGAAVVVFPGGGFEVLAMDLEGTEVCHWLTSAGVTCVLLKYRVPSIPYRWSCNCRPHNFEVPVPALQDAQRTIRLVRAHASKWHIDPHKIGVIGFSAGGFLVAEISTQFDDRLYAPVDAADRESARPDFAMAIYPGHLADDAWKLNPNVPVSHATPPTFLVQAENDHVDGVRQALVYYTALTKAGVPAEMHLYAHGGHAFGLRRTKAPITRWPALATKWMRTIGVLAGHHAG